MDFFTLCFYGHLGIRLAVTFAVGAGLVVPRLQTLSGSMGGTDEKLDIFM